MLYQVNILVCLLMCSHISSHNYRNKHASLEIISKPDISQEAKRLLRRYGSLHTMREYIYWAITEENIYLYLHKIINCLAFEHKLIKRHLRRIRSELQYKSNIFARSTRFRNLYRATIISSCKDMKVNTNSAFKVQGKEFQEIWIGSSELYLSIAGLLTIQKISLRSPEQLLNFNVGGTNHVTLTQQHILLIGMCSLFRKMYSFAVTWLEKLQQFGSRFKQSNKLSEKNVSIDLVEFVGHVSIQEHNRALSKPKCSKDYSCYMNLFTMPISRLYGNGYTKLLTRRLQLLDKNSKPGTHGIPEDQSIKLCSTSVPNINPTWIQAKLKCHYEQFRHPYLYINPVKTEKLSDSPSIYQYYEIVGPQLIKELIAHYEENATLLAMISNMNRYSGSIGLEKMSANSVYDDSLWEKYAGHPTFYRLAEFVTGIKYDGGATERFSYIDYIPGRTVEAHDDIYRENPELNEHKLDGNRYADIVYYLGISEKGGETAFCQAGLKGYQTKRSMLVWTNKFKNGTNRNDLHHAACPVIHGNKLVLSQGVLYLQQWNNVKCSLNQFE